MRQWLKMVALGAVAALVVAVPGAAVGYEGDDAPNGTTERATEQVMEQTQSRLGQPDDVAPGTMEQVQERNRLQLRDGSGENCVGDCDGDQTRDRVRDRDQLRDGTGENCVGDCDGDQTRDRVRDRDQLRDGPVRTALATVMGTGSATGIDCGSSSRIAKPDAGPRGSLHASTAARCTSPCDLPILTRWPSP